MNTDNRGIDVHGGGAAIHVDVIIVIELREDDKLIVINMRLRTPTRLDPVTSPVLPPANSRAHVLPDVYAEEVEEHEEGVRVDEACRFKLGTCSTARPKG